MEKPAPTAGASKAHQGTPRKEKRPGDDHHDVLATSTSSFLLPRSNKKARRTVGLPKAPPLQAETGSALSLAVEFCPELFHSDELAAASQTCRDVHQTAHREASKRWARIGWGSHTVLTTDPNGDNNNHDETKLLLPTGFAPMGLFSRVTAARVLEGLVVAAQGGRQRLCDRLAAFGARVVRTSRFSESLRTENIDFCVWGGFTSPPTKAGLAEYYYESEGGAVPPLGMRPPVLWEPVLESLLFSPWVSTSCTDSMEHVPELTEVQVNELLTFADMTREDLRNAEENDLVNWTAETHRNVASGDEVRGYSICDNNDGDIRDDYLYQEKDQIETIPFFSNYGFEWYVSSWSEAPPGPGSTASTWSRAAATALYQQTRERSLSNVYTPLLFGTRDVGCSWFQDWSSSATPVSITDRLRQWRECLAALKTKEILDLERDRAELYWQIFAPDF